MPIRKSKSLIYCKKELEEINPWADASVNDYVLLALDYSTVNKRVKIKENKKRIKK